MLLLATAAPLRAEGDDAANGVNPSPTRLRSGFAALDRPHGMIEGGAGMTLPAAEVCVERSSGCKQGDLSFAPETWQLFRPNTDFAVGAGIVLGLIPTAHPPHEDPEGIERDQTRSYLTLRATIPSSSRRSSGGSGLREAWWWFRTTSKSSPNEPTIVRYSAREASPSAPKADR
jgi:hypothetical protein